MRPEVSKVIANLLHYPPATEPEISGALKACSSALPQDYVEIMRQTNGGEGFVGESYFRLYPIQKLAQLNQAYGVNEFAPGLIIFGSNSGGEAFAFDTRTTAMLVVQIPFIPMLFQYAEHYPGTFVDFLLSLA